MPRQRSLHFNHPARGARAPRRAARHSLLALAACASLAACLAGDDPALDDDPGNAEGALGGDSATSNGGSAGDSALGGAGDSAVGGVAAAASNSGSAGEATGGGASGSDESSGGEIDEVMPVSPGETGVFEGATAAHNATRRALDLPDLRWSDELAAVAQDWSDTLAEECGSIHHRPDGAYGENIAARGSRPFVEPFSAEQAVQGWVDEVACWQYGTITGRGVVGTEVCDAACATSLRSSGCGHYTQVVWRDTESVGCGYSTCKRDGVTLEMWVCNYDPPGNYVGQAPY